METFLFLTIVGLLAGSLASRSNIGQRSTRPHPRWAEKLGDRDIPRIIRPEAFQSIMSFGLAIFCAVIPFAKRPRRGPLDKWMAFCFAISYFAGGIIFGLLQVALYLLDLQGTGNDPIHTE